MKGKQTNLSHALIVQAASTQIDMVTGGNGTGIISKLMLFTISNSLCIGSVSPEKNMEIGLVAHDFNNLSTTAKK